MASIRKRADRWQVQVRRIGNRPVSKSFLTLKDAKAWARNMELRADRQDLPPDPRELERYTLKDLVTRYRDTVTPRKRGCSAETVMLNAFLRHRICRFRLSELGPDHFASFRDERLLVVKAHTVKRQLATIHNLFEIAKNEWLVPIKENPLGRIKVECPNNRRERRLDRDELNRLLECVRKTRNPLVLPILLFALKTGLRRSEILAMRWNNIDLKNRQLIIPNSKNGHSRTIPLSSSATTLLESLRSPESTRVDFVFPTTANALRLAWRRLSKRANVQNLRFHDLRHEAISRFFEYGLTVPEVASISGHKDMRMLFRYGHAERVRVQRLLDIAESTSQLDEASGVQDADSKQTGSGYGDTVESPEACSPRSP